MSNAFAQRSAIISECGLYRYVLTRCWAPSSKRICWVMLNPSTADAKRDDPTIRRCVDFSIGWGYGSMVVVNLFALRATNPNALRIAEHPLGPDNFEHLIRETTQAECVVAAWGAHGIARDQGRSLKSVLASAGIPMMCLGTTKMGYPRHPLYVPKTKELETYP